MDRHDRGALKVGKCWSAAMHSNVVGSAQTRESYPAYKIRGILCLRFRETTIPNFRLHGAMKIRAFFHNSAFPKNGPVIFPTALSNLVISRHPSTVLPATNADCSAWCVAMIRMIAQTSCRFLSKPQWKHRVSVSRQQSEPTKTSANPCFARANPPARKSAFSETLPGCFCFRAFTFLWVKMRFLPLGSRSSSITRR